MKKYIFIINYFYIFNNFSIFCNTNNDESTEILYDDLYFNNNKNIKENIFNYDPFEISQMDSNGEIPIKKKEKKKIQKQINSSEIIFYCFIASISSIIVYYIIKFIIKKLKLSERKIITINKQQEKIHKENLYESIFDDQSFNRNTIDNIFNIITNDVQSWKLNDNDPIDQTSIIKTFYKLFNIYNKNIEENHEKNQEIKLQFKNFYINLFFFNLQLFQYEEITKIISKDIQESHYQQSTVSQKIYKKFQPIVDKLHEYFQQNNINLSLKALPLQYQLKKTILYKKFLIESASYREIKNINKPYLNLFLFQQFQELSNHFTELLKNNLKTIQTRCPACQEEQLIQVKLWYIENYENEISINEDEFFDCNCYQFYIKDGKIYDFDKISSVEKKKLKNSNTNLINTSKTPQLTESEKRMLLTGLRFYKIGREQFIFSYDYTTRYDENGQLIHQERQSYQAEELLNRLSNPHSEEQINNFTQDEILQLQYLIRTIGLETYN